MSNIYEQFDLLELNQFCISNTFEIVFLSFEDNITSISEQFQEYFDGINGEKSILSSVTPQHVLNFFETNIKDVVLPKYLKDYFQAIHAEIYQNTQKINEFTGSNQMLEETAEEDEALDIRDIPVITYAKMVKLKLIHTLYSQYVAAVVRMNRRKALEKELAELAKCDEGKSKGKGKEKEKSSKSEKKSKISTKSEKPKKIEIIDDYTKIPLESSDIIENDLKDLRLFYILSGFENNLIIELLKINVDIVTVFEMIPQKLLHKIFENPKRSEVLAETYLVKFHDQIYGPIEDTITRLVINLDNISDIRKKHRIFLENLIITHVDEDIPLNVRTLFEYNAAMDKYPPEFINISLIMDALLIEVCGPEADCRASEIDPPVETELLHSFQIHESDTLGKIRFSCNKPTGMEIYETTLKMLEICNPVNFTCDHQRIFSDELLPMKNMLNLLFFSQLNNANNFINYQWKERLPDAVLHQLFYEFRSKYTYLERFYCEDTDNELVYFHDNLNDCNFNRIPWDVTLETEYCLRDFYTEKQVRLQPNYEPSLSENSLQSDEKQPIIEQAAPIGPIGYDLGPNTVRLIGSTTIFQNSDNFKLTIDNSRFINEEDRCSIVIDMMNNTLVIHTRPFKYHFILVDGTIVAFCDSNLRISLPNELIADFLDDNSVKQQLNTRNYRIFSDKGILINKSGCLTILKHNGDSIELPDKYFKLDGNVMWENFGEIEEKQLLLTVREEDFLHEEISYKREDGLIFLLEKNGKQYVQFPDGTKISTWYKTREDDEWVYVELSYKYEHPDYLPVCFWRDKVIEIGLNDCVSVRKIQDERFNINIREIDVWVEKHCLYVDHEYFKCQAFNRMDFSFCATVCERKIIVNHSGDCEISDKFHDDGDKSRFEELFIIEDRNLGFRLWSNDKVADKIKNTDVVKDDPERHILEFYDNFYKKFNEKFRWELAEVVLTKYKTASGKFRYYTTYRCLEQIFGRQSIETFSPFLRNYSRKLFANFMPFWKDIINNFITVQNHCDVQIQADRKRGKSFELRIKEWKEKCQEMKHLFSQRQVPCYFKSKFCTFIDLCRCEIK